MKKSTYAVVFGGSNVGDYSGYSLRGGYGFTDRFWLEGEVWQRKVAYRNEIEDITSWQAAAQYRLTGGQPRSGAQGQ